MKEIPGYEGLYSATSCGKIWSHRNQKFLKPAKNEKGYWKVCLSNNNNRKQYFLHRLIALTFVPNPNPELFDQVGHEDDNKDHNYVGNLYWTNSLENNNHNNKNLRIAKAVYCVELDQTFVSLSEGAKQTGAHLSNIHRSCNNPNRTAGGYHWRYADEN